MTPNIHCRLLDMPTTIPAFVISNADCSYTIVLNSRLSHEQHLKSYAHEMQHIENGDYEKKCSADLIELWTHN